MVLQVEFASYCYLAVKKGTSLEIPDKLVENGENTQEACYSGYRNIKKLQTGIQAV